MRLRSATHKVRGLHPPSPPPPRMEPLRLENVTKRFGQGDRVVEAMANVSLTVPGGRFVAVMGQSGSGKSTLLHLAAGLARADEGVVRVAGEDLGRLDDRSLTYFRRRKIGLIFQSFNLIPTLTAEENVALPLMLEGGRTARSALDRADELLRDLNLSHRLGHRPDAMSGGEQQRVAVARAMIADPAILLADEPTGNLDSENGQNVCDLLVRLVQEGRTIVMVTHEPSVAAVADEVVVMRDGRTVGSFETPGRDPAAVARAYHQIVSGAGSPPAAAEATAV